MKSFKKRLAAIVVVVLMIATLIPTMALAAGSIIKTQPTDVTKTVGQDATFTVVPEDSGVGDAPTYVWKVSTDGGATYEVVPGVSTATLTVSSVTAKMNGNRYACEMTTGGQGAPTTPVTEISDIVKLTVTSGTEPEVYTQPASVSKMVGEDAQFNVVLTTNLNIDAYTYQWEMKKNGKGEWVSADGIGRATGTLDVKDVTMAQNGNIYRCKVTTKIPDTKEFVYTDEAKLTVTEPVAPEPGYKPVVNVSMNPSSGWVKDKGVTFTAEIEAKATTEQLAIQWYFQKSNGIGGYEAEAAIEGATSAAYTIDKLDATKHLGKYTCKVINNNPLAEGANTESSELEISAINNPTGAVVIVTEPEAPTRVYAGDKVELTVEATTDNDGTLSYQWMSAPKGLDVFTNIEGATAPTYVIEKATDKLGKFKCVVTNSIGAATNETAEVAINLTSRRTEPSFDKDLENKMAVKLGDTPTLSVHANVETSDTISYQWSVITTAGVTNVIPGATGESYTLPAAIAAADNGKIYFCTATNTVTKETKESAETELVVVDPALVPVIEGQPQSIIAEAINGEDVTMEVKVKAIDGKTFTYQWEKQNGTAWDEIYPYHRSSGFIEPEDGKLTFKQGYTAAEDGVYRCVVTVNGTGTNGEFAISDTATFLAYTADTPYLTTDLPATMDAEAGKTATFQVAAAVQPEAPLVYQWYTVDGLGNETAIPGAKSASYTTGVLTEADNGAMFKCIVTNQDMGDSVDSTVMTLNVKTSITPPVIDDGAVGEGLTVDRDKAMLNTPPAGNSAAGALKASDLRDNITAPAGYSIVVEDKDGNVLSGDKAVGTGCVVKMVADADGSVADTLSIMVKGDVTGKGYASLIDMMKLNSVMTSTGSIDGVYFTAADMNDDAVISLIDMMRLNAIVTSFVA